MNNIFNIRVRRLIKDFLRDYAIHFLWFIGFAFFLPLALNLLFGTAIMTVSIGNFEEVHTWSIFHFATFGVFVIIMLIAGIEDGYELPRYVRIGISRREYFFATTTAAVIISLLAGPVILMLNLILNLFLGAESLFYNMSNISTLGMQLFMYIAVFLLGFCGTVLWQRVAWYVAVAVTVVFFVVMSFLGWSFAFIFDIFTFRNDADFLGIDIAISNGLLAGIAAVMIVVFGMATYGLIKNVSVKVK